MNWRERFLQIALFILLFWALNAVISKALSYFFPMAPKAIEQRIKPTQSAVAGSCYEVQTVAEVSMPLLRDVDFLDSSLPSGEAQQSYTVLTSEQLQYQFSSFGAGLSNGVYSQIIEDKAIDMNFLQQSAGNDLEQALFLVALDKETPYVYQKLAGDGAGFIAENKDARITKRFSVVKDLPVVDLEITIEPLGTKSVRPRIFVAAPNLDLARDWDKYPGFVVSKNGKIDKIYAKKIAQSVWAQPEVIGVQDRYFACALVTDIHKFVRRGYFWLTPEGRPGFILEGPEINTAHNWKMRFYCGPKETAKLASVDARLEGLMEYGWFSFFAQWLLWILNLVNHYVKNYGWAIVIVTIVMNLLLAPFTNKSIISGWKAEERQREYSRKQALIKKKYANDPEMLRQAQMELMKEMGIGASQILPLLLQTPFFIALNRVLSSAIELYHAPFVFWITDLSQPDAILPWIVGFAMVASMVLTGMHGGKKKIQPVQLLVALVMALVFMGVAFKLSAGLTIFILVGLLFRLLQGFILKRVYA